MKGSKVQQVQECIFSHGHIVGPIDGIFGKLTYAEIRSYQEKNNLIIDGIIGPQTASYMNAQSGLGLDGKTKF
ncbi:peptidoglycan-binding protein [Polaribacter sp. MSW13]|uniref:Peptidoglycan-binding protein n=1 Tax=Polaribacter marinus TaxID=2916838 RepID=A0A9X1VQD8_9FLAO|nr:peptidoglycan-binding domain-containing protein [Polaribacter marinus]MCI2229928.1 peptidoglycan-binding protein [Polaribacter marinus]